MVPCPVRCGSAPECQAGASPDIPGGCAVGQVRAGDGRRAAGSCGRDLHGATRRKTMSDLQGIADRVQIEALRGEAADAAMMRDYDRVASLFTPDAVVRIPHIGAEAIGREEI